MPICAADKEGGPRQVYVAKGTGTNHTVTEWTTGFFSCTCPDWRMRRNLLLEHDRNAPRNNHCKHIHSVFDGWIVNDNPNPLAKIARTPVGVSPMFRQRMEPSRISPLSTGRAISFDEEEV